MAVRLLTGPEMDAMETEFEALEARMRADGSYDRLHGLADRLTAAFRPDPARMAAAPRWSAAPAHSRRLARLARLNDGARPARW